MQGKGSATHNAFSIYLEPYLCVFEIINDFWLNNDDLLNKVIAHQTKADAVKELKYFIFISHLVGQLDNGEP